ncbi:Hypothetical Protein FCC1311_022915, partial [Hondaea fermentalgiana]
ARAAARGRAARAPAEVAVSLAVSFVRRGLRERGRPPLAGEQHAHLEAVCASVLESVGARIPEVVECLDTSRDVEDRTRKLEDLVVVLAEAVLASVLDTDAFPLARADDAKSLADTARQQTWHEGGNLVKDISVSKRHAVSVFLDASRKAAFASSRRGAKVRVEPGRLQSQKGDQGEEE